MLERYMNQALLVALTTVVAACGGPSGLSQDEVSSIPDGDGLGSPLDGLYTVQVRTIECSGSCGPFTVGFFSASVCDVGEVQTEYLTVTQEGGHLRVDTSDTLSRFEGAAYQDGSFDVGGYVTQFGGDLEITARSVGRIDETGRIDATLRSLTWGEVGGDGADCYGVREVTGTR